MRQIKFRGKRIDNGEWVYGSLLNNVFVSAKDSKPILEIVVCPESDYYDCLSDLEDAGYVVKVIAETVGQYTGLKDKNGKEIYEGDIVQLFTTKTEIIFSCGAFGYMSSAFEGELIVLGRNYHFEWKNDKSEKIEVIGNIYENAELLNQPK